MTYQQRIQDLRASLGVTQAELAKRVGATIGSISAIERGEVKRPHSLLDIAKALGTTPDWLLYGKENTEITKAILPSGKMKAPREVRFAPIITWSQALDWGQYGEYIKVDMLKGLPLLGSESQHSYALKVKNNLMAARSGRELSFLLGDLLICDPSLTAILEGHLVIVRIESQKEALFSQLAKEGSRWYLTPLNSQFPAIAFNRKTMAIVATVIRRMTEFSYG